MINNGNAMHSGRQFTINDARNRGASTTDVSSIPLPNSNREMEFSSGADNYVEVKLTKEILLQFQV